MTHACPGCSASIDPSWKVCPHCGATLQDSTAPPPPADASFSDRPGTVVAGTRISEGAPRVDLGGPRYEVEAELGRGGMGVVYRARDTRLDRRVALKRLLTQGDDPHAIARFLTEARAVAALNHPNILTVYDVGEDEGGHYIAMELIDGISLDRLLVQEGRRLSIERAVSLFRGICEGIAYAHRRNVIHRDIKPSNVLVTNDGTPKVVDFGLARQGLTSALSMTGFGMGTMDYAAPEQKRDAKNVDHRADVYSLGCTFYELLTGHAPPPHSDQIPDAYRPIVLKATHPDPAERYFSVQEMLVALSQVSSSQPPREPVPPPRRVTPEPPLPPPTPPLPKASSRGSRELGKLQKSKWYRSVKPFWMEPESPDVPDPKRAAYHQLTCRGFRYLGHEPKRLTVYFAAAVIMLAVFAMAALDEFRDEEEFTSIFTPLFFVYVAGIIDVAHTARRIVKGELHVERRAD